MAKFSYEKLRFAAYLVLDAFSLAMPTSRPSGAVLIVRQDAIGDFILWLDAARVLSDHYRRQGRKVCLLANKAWADWAIELSLFDEVIPLDLHAFQYNPLYRLRLSRTIRRAGLATAIQPAYSRSHAVDVLIRLSAAPERIAFIGNNANLRPWERALGDPWYTHLLHADPAPRMELIRNAEFIRGLLRNDYQACVANLHQFGTICASALFTSEISPGEPYYVLFPGASWEGRQWPVDHFRALAQRIHSHTGWRGVVCGGPGDRRIAAQLCNDAPCPLLDWTGRTTLQQLAGILDGAQFLVANETSAVHLAAAVGTAAICILGGGHYGRFLPYEIERPSHGPLPFAVTFPMPCFICNWHCIFERSSTQAVPCIGNIAVDQVWAALLSQPRLLA